MTFDKNAKILSRPVRRQFSIRCPKICKFDLNFKYGSAWLSIYLWREEKMFAESYSLSCLSHKCVAVREVNKNILCEDRRSLKKLFTNHVVKCVGVKCIVLFVDFLPLSIFVLRLA